METMRRTLVVVVSWFHRSTVDQRLQDLRILFFTDFLTEEKLRTPRSSRLLHSVMVSDARNRAADNFRYYSGCLSDDPARRSAMAMKVALIALHLVFAGVLFLVDGDLITKTKYEPWYTALYVLLFIAALAQYFFTAGSSPGFVLDAMRVSEESDALIKRQTTSNENGSLPITVDSSQFYRNNLEGNMSSWTKLVMNMYPPGSSVRSLTCPYCNVVQPPRSKHCQDCDKCVLQFDHHCVWLGTCIGQRNHCRFWWYIFEETALGLWTEILYFSYLKSNMLRAWWKDAIMIMLLITLTFALIFVLLLLLFHSYLILTNQTTYELVRRRRIPYLREIPERIYPFSNGVCINIYNFFCARSSLYYLEPLPRAHEIEAKARPYTCLDILRCRCC
ncbi:hypothetical protein QQ045_017929 [Rhodiola kirilowii]